MRRPPPFPRSAGGLFSYWLSLPTDYTNPNGKGPAPGNAGPLLLGSHGYFAAHHARGFNYSIVNSPASPRSGAKRAELSKAQAPSKAAKYNSTPFIVKSTTVS